MSRKCILVFLLAITLCASAIGCAKKREGNLGKPLPSFKGATGIIGKQPRNTKKDFVLVHFFSLTSVASKETASSIEELAKQYSENGLKSIFVLSPEYSFNNISQSIQEVAEQTWDVIKTEPVLLDGDYKIWGAFGITKYGYTAISKNGIIVFESPVTTNLHEIDSFLMSNLPGMPSPQMPQPLPPIWTATQIQCGYISGRIGNCSGKEIERVFPFDDPKSYKPNTPYLKGTWYVGPEMVWHTKANEIGRLSFTFEGYEVFAVLKSQDGTPVYATVWIDGESPTNENAGKNLQGQKLVVVKPGIYELLKGLPEGWHTITIETLSDNLVVYSFEVR